MTALTPRGRRALAVAGTVAIACGVALAVVTWPDDDSPDAAPLPAPTTPMWSPRRVPVSVAESASRLALDARLADITDGAEACVTVRSEGETISDRNGATPLVPASTLKLVTSVGVLQALGPDARLATRALASTPRPDGSLGDLYLVGGGDPTLGTASYAAALASRPRYARFPITRLEDLADGVVAAGVRRIDGRVIADDSRHDDAQVLPSWGDRYLPDVGPLGALTVNGGVPGTEPRAPDPALHVADTFVALLEARGIHVTGGAAHGVAPGSLGELARVESPTIAEVVSAFLVASDNFSVEELTREAGVASGGDGSTTAGTGAVIEGAASAGVPVEGLVAADGSGLSRDDRATCHAIATALALRTRGDLGAIDAGLPVAGRTGTLSGRFLGTPLEGRLRAKTGNIDGVVSLAGVIDIPRTPTFSFIANGDFGTGAGRALQEAVAQAIAGFPSIAASDAAPAP